MPHEGDNDLIFPFLGEPTSAGEPSCVSKHRFVALGFVLLCCTGITLVAHRFKDCFSSQIQDPQATLRYQPILGWSKVDTLIDGKNSFDHMGYSTAISEDGTILVGGAPFFENHKGFIRILEKKGGAYTSIGNAIFGKDGDKLGFSVDVTNDGKWAIAGAPYENNYKGCVNMYQINKSTFNPNGKICGTNKKDTFGFSVAMADEDEFGNKRVRAVIGAPAYSSLSKIGYARVFEYNTALASWDQVNGDIEGVPKEEFGTSVSMSLDGKILAIGAPAKNKVSIFKENVPWWTKIGNDIVVNAKRSALCGSAVSLSEKGDKVAIGCQVSNTVYIFEYQINSWVGTKEIKGEMGEVGFGKSISMNQNRIAIGGPYLKSDSGHCCVYEWKTVGIDMDWVKVDQDIDGIQGEAAGWSVALSSDGKYVSCGSPKYSSNNLKKNGNVCVWEE